MTRRFAEDTKVGVDASAAEVKKRLRAAGADAIAVFEGGGRSVIAFTLEARQYRLTVPIPEGAKNAAQEERRAWRLLLLLVKAKLEAVREGATTIEREFFADLVMPNGATLITWAAPQVDEAYRVGHMPTSLMLEGPKP